jgi:hypothetical protein
LVSSQSPFDPVPILRALADAGVDFVVIGGVAGGVHGSAYPTYDVDVAYARDKPNLELISGVLRSLNATLRGAPSDVSFQLDAKTLERGGNFTFDTEFGPFDILAYPAGAAEYARLREDARVIDVEGRRLRVASLDHLIAMKEASDRPKDKLMALEYRLLADEERSQS